MPTPLERQFEMLNDMLSRQTDIIARTVAQAIDAAERRDCNLARKIIDRDLVINVAEVDIEEECLHALACYQPVATDLRYVVSILKVNNDLERIGDHAVKIAELACFLANEPPADLMQFIDGMGEQVLAMLHMALEALLQSDIEKAQQVRNADDRIDTIHRRMYEQVETAMRQNPGRISQFIHIINISRQLERIADLCVNICEDVIYAVQGEILRHRSTAAPQL